MRRDRKRTEVDEELPRCAQCGKAIDYETDLPHCDCGSGRKFCSMRCAERYESIMHDEEE